MTDKLLTIADLPENAGVRFTGKNIEWAWGIGGHGLKANQITLTHVNEDLSAEVYVMPDWVAELITSAKTSERNKVQGAIRSALGL